MTAKFIVEVVKSLFGISGDSSADSEEGAESETEITVEREPEGDDGFGRVEETDEEGEEAVEEDVAEEEEAETVEEEGEAEEEVEETEEEDEAEEAVEEEDEADEAEEEVEDTEEEEEAEDTGAEESEESTPVSDINGIGPTYSDRLTDVGIGTVAALAEADAETVADAAQVSESRAGDWIEQAQSR